jgi:mycothiol synthase
MSKVDGDLDAAKMSRGRLVHFRRARRDETQAALRLILGSPVELAGDEQVVDFLRFAMYRRIDLDQMWLAEDGRSILWAILPVVSAGRTMLLFSPSFVDPGLAEAVIPALVEKVLEGYATGVQLAQVLVDPGDDAVIDLYQGQGFVRLAELVYLSRDLHRMDPPSLLPGWHWLIYQPDTYRLFAQTIAASYEGSCDCPGLTGVRTIEDVLEGHKAVGQFDPNLWYLLCEGGEAVGVSLLNRSPHSESIELVYFGLVPRARGRGLGNLLMRHTLAAASTANAQQLTLAVDAINAPALRLYHRHGLRQVCSRIALMRQLEKAEAPAHS